LTVTVGLFRGIIKHGGQQLPGGHVLRVCTQGAHQLAPGSFTITGVDTLPDFVEQVSGHLSFLSVRSLF
jgi:hypothetical protein